MAIKVLVVDDSSFFRRRICELLNSDPRLDVVGSASNGREAVEMAFKVNPDIITMDYEMPVMDGITAIRHILDKRAIPILMFSSLTHEGARVTFDALEAGAMDYLPKNFEDINSNSKRLRAVLYDKIIGIVQGRKDITKHTEQNKLVQEPVAPVVAKAAAKTRRKSCRLIAIGTSTGGPIALQEVLTKIPANFKIPIVLVQHMPEAFTRAFAERLDRLCKITVKQAEDGDVLKSGQALLAPGGKQMMIDKRNSGSIKILVGDERLNYKPSVDITFGSAAKVFPGSVLGVILTGMGSDGKEGARLLKNTGSLIWAQDEASCVIAGMPLAVINAHLTDEVHSLSNIGVRLAEEI